jgi:hypothetical protein
VHTRVETKTRRETAPVQVLEQTQHFIPALITGQRQADDAVELRLCDRNDERTEIKAIDSGQDRIIRNKNKQPHRTEQTP